MTGLIYRSNYKSMMEQEIRWINHRFKYNNVEIKNIVLDPPHGFVLLIEGSDKEVAAMLSDADQQY